MTPPRTSHPWAIVEGGRVLWHVPGSWPPVWEEDEALEAIWRAKRRNTMQPYYEANGITIFNARCEDVLPGLTEKPALVLADPPYGDDHRTDYAVRFSGGKHRRDGTAHPRYNYVQVEGDQVDFDPSHILALNTETILWGANRYGDKLPTGSLLIWDKRTPMGSKGVMSDAEVAWWSHGRGVYIFSHTWDGFNRASERGPKVHSTQKPVALMRWCLLRAKLAPGALVLDPYMGSGPVAQACKELGYRYIGIDVVEQYCEVAANRLQQEVMELV